MPAALGVLAIAWSAGLAGYLAHPIGPLRSITAHQSVRALPLLALALAVLAGLALGTPRRRPSPARRGRPHGGHRARRLAEVP